MNKHAMSIVVAYCLALAGCAAVREVTAPTLCSFSDADGRLYEAVDIEPMAALVMDEALSGRKSQACNLRRYAKVSRLRVYVVDLNPMLARLF